MRAPFFVRIPWLHVKALTLWFVVLYVGDLPESIRRHETIHFKQYNETFAIGFLLLYLWDWLKGYYQVRDFWGAYYLIRFEQEAYAHEKDEDYLSNRNRNAWKEFSVQVVPD